MKFINICISTIVLILCFTYLSNAQNCSCDDLKNGKYESYEKGKKIGVFYRKENIQIERYLNENKYHILIFTSKGCNYNLKFKETKEYLDTITWSVYYKKIRKDKYSYIGKPKYINTPYFNEGVVFKIKDKIKDKKILNIFKKIKNAPAPPLPHDCIVWDTQ